MFEELVDLTHIDATVYGEVTVGPAALEPDDLDQPRLGLTIEGQTEMAEALLLKQWREDTNAALSSPRLGIPATYLTADHPVLGQHQRPLTTIITFRWSGIESLGPPIPRFRCGALTAHKMLTDSRSD